jgi:hypothetical protein
MARADEPDVVDSAAARLLTRLTEQTAIRGITRRFCHSRPRRGSNEI